MYVKKDHACDGQVFYAQNRKIYDFFSIILFYCILRVLARMQGSLLINERTGFSINSCRKYGVRYMTAAAMHSFYQVTRVSNKYFAFAILPFLL